MKRKVYHFSSLHVCMHVQDCAFRAIVSAVAVSSGSHVGSTVLLSGLCR